MEGPDWPLSVIEQVGEIRRAIAVVHAVHDAEVDLQRLLHVEEDAPDGRRFLAGRELFYRSVGDEVNVELGPEVLDRCREVGAEALPFCSKLLRVQLAVAREVIMKERSVTAGREGEAVVDYDRLDVVVQHCRDG